MNFAELAPFTATCATVGCQNQGIPFEVVAAATDPYVLCGACGTRIGQVTDPEPAPEEVVAE